MSGVVVETRPGGRAGEAATAAAVALAEEEPSVVGSDSEEEEVSGPVSPLKEWEADVATEEEVEEEGSGGKALADAAAADECASARIAAPDPVAADATATDVEEEEGKEGAMGSRMEPGCATFLCDWCPLSISEENKEGMVARGATAPAASSTPRRSPAPTLSPPSMDEEAEARLPILLAPPLGGSARYCGAPAGSSRMGVAGDPALLATPRPPPPPVRPLSTDPPPPPKPPPP